MTSGGSVSAETDAVSVIDQEVNESISQSLFTYKKMASMVRRPIKMYVYPFKGR